MEYLLNLLLFTNRVCFFAVIWKLLFEGLTTCYDLLVIGVISLPILMFNLYKVGVLIHMLGYTEYVVIVVILMSV